MGDVQWIKLYVNTFNISRKLKQIEQMKGGDTILIIWIKLLCLAGSVNDGGMVYVTPDIPFTVEGLAEELRKPAKTVKTALDVLSRYEQIVVDDAGFIKISSWEKYQDLDRLEEIRAQDRERQRRRRERQKQENNCDVSRDGHVTETLGVTGSHAIEEEGEEEQEFHSFNRSIAREEEYIESRVKEAGFKGQDAEDYRQEVKEGLRRKYFGGTLGQGVVLMSDEQFESLCDFLTLDELEKYFGIVVECEKSGKRYRKKTHYQAILEMAMKDRKVK